MISIWGNMSGGSAVPGPPTHAAALLIETGFFLLLESGFHILLES